ncbi:hypothetical protein PIB30_029158 [Stylosanthes scabra]|uniref:Uncharacterized protein n=1 Tax=Stylosanthes scabra TaxID=79078 RepID=A0ABU6YBP5_9FABA|nr:hypothetical protein [Stylosanthes scabra]
MSPINQCICAGSQPIVKRVKLAIVTSTALKKNLKSRLNPRFRYANLIHCEDIPSPVVKFTYFTVTHGSDLPTHSLPPLSPLPVLSPFPSAVAPLVTLRQSPLPTPLLALRRNSKPVITLTPASTAEDIAFPVDIFYVSEEKLTYLSLPRCLSLEPHLHSLSSSPTAAQLIS